MSGIALERSKSKAYREIITAFAIFMREATVALKSPGTLVVSLVMPIIMMGMIGGNLMQNMAGSLSYQYGAFMMVGMLINVLFTSTANGVASLVDDNDSNFSEEMLIAPVSRHSIVVGKILGSMFSAIISMAGTLIVGLFMGITLTLVQLLAIIALSPLICLSAGALVMVFIGLIKNKKVANGIVMTIVMPQMFLSGGIIPINQTTGILKIISRCLPMTYCLDLVRAVVYSKSAEYSSIVMFNPIVNFISIISLTIIFLMAGTYFYAKTEKNK